jgi:hypothetical protein
MKEPAIDKIDFRQPVAMVFDRTNAEKPSVRDTMHEAGGGWAEVFEIWWGSGLAYLVLLAHTEERVRKCAPLAFMAKDDDGLRGAIVACCAHLSNVRCYWMYCTVPRSAGDVIAREEGLRDTVIQGHA